MRNCLIAMIVTFSMMTQVFAEEKTDLAKAVPQDALVFIKANDFKSISEKSKNNGYTKIFEDETIKAFIDKIKENFDNSFSAELNKEIAKTQSKFNIPEEKKEEIKKLLESGEIWDILNEIAAGDFVFYVASPKDGTFDNPKDDLELAVIAEINNSNKKIDYLLGLVESIIENNTEISSNTSGNLTIKTIKPKEAKSDNIPSLSYAYNDKYFIFSNNSMTVTSLFKTLKSGGLKDNILGSEELKASLRNAPENVDVKGLINIEKIISVLPQEKQPEQPAQNPEMMMQRPPKANRKQILDALGVSGMKSFGWYGYLTDEGVKISNALLYAPGEKTGILKLLSESPVEQTIPTYYPQSTALYESVRITPTKLLDSIIEIGSKINPAFPMIIDMSLASVKQQHGFDIREQLLNAFGDEISFSMIFEGEPQDISNVDPNMAPMVMSFQMAKALLISAELKDGELIKNSIKSLQAIAATKNPMMASSYEEEYKGVKINILGMNMPGFPVPCYIIIQNKLFFALNVDTIKLMIDGLSTENKSATANKAQMKADKIVGNDPSICLMAVDEANYCGWYSGFIKQLIQLSIKKQTAIHTSATAAPDGQAAPVAPKHPLEMLIDFSLWPEGAVFKKYLGYTVVRVIPVEDGILIKGASTPAITE